MADANWLLCALALVVGVYIGLRLAPGQGCSKKKTLDSGAAMDEVRTVLEVLRALETASRPRHGKSKRKKRE